MMLKPEELLLDAVASRYVYPPQFPGFAAEIHSHSLRGCIRGSIVYSPSTSLEFYPSVSPVSPEDRSINEAAMNEVLDMTAEMWSGGRAARSAGFPVVYGANENSVGVLLDVPDDPEHLQYRIKGRRVQQMAWIEDDHRVVMTTLEVVHVDKDSILPHFRTVSRLSLVDGRLLSTTSIVDTYQRVEGFPLPNRRRVFLTTPDGDVYDREIHITNPTLLSIPDVWPDL